jgi:2-oxoisovalerate dehydrogenase E1 component
MSEKDWDASVAKAEERVRRAAQIADQRPVSQPEAVTRFVFSEGDQLQDEGGLWNSGYEPPRVSDIAKPEGARINMITAIRRVLDNELAVNPRVLIFGEDVGPKGGVHGVTLGLQERYGEGRVFDTSLSESAALSAWRSLG